MSIPSSEYLGINTELKRLQNLQSFIPDLYSGKKLEGCVSDIHFLHLSLQFILFIGSYHDKFQKNRHVYNQSIQTGGQAIEIRSVMQVLLAVANFFELIVTDCKDEKGISSAQITKGLEALEKSRPYMSEFMVNSGTVAREIECIKKLCQNPDVPKEGDLLMFGSCWNKLMAPSIELYHKSVDYGSHHPFIVDDHFDSAFPQKNQDSVDYNLWYSFKSVINIGYHFKNIFCSGLPVSIVDMLNDALQDIRSIVQELLLLKPESQSRAKQKGLKPPYNQSEIAFIAEFIASKETKCIHELMGIEVVLKLGEYYNAHMLETIEKIACQRMKKLDKEGYLPRCMDFLRPLLPYIEVYFESFDDLKDFYYSEDYQTSIKKLMESMEELYQIQLFVHDLCLNHIAKVNKVELEKRYKAFEDKEKTNVRLVALMKAIPSSLWQNLKNSREKITKAKEMMTGMPSLLNVMGYISTDFRSNYKIYRKYHIRLLIEEVMNKQKRSLSICHDAQPEISPISESDDDESAEGMEAESQIVMTDATTDKSIEESPTKNQSTPISELSKSLLVQPTQVCRFTDACLSNATSLVKDLCSELSDAPHLKERDQIVEHFNSVFATTCLLTEQFISAALLHAAKPKIWAVASPLLRHSHKEMLLSLTKITQKSYEHLKDFDDVEKAWERLFGRSENGLVIDFLLKIEKEEIDTRLGYRLLFTHLDKLVSFIQDEFGSSSGFFDVNVLLESQSSILNEQVQHHVPAINKIHEIETTTHEIKKLIVELDIFIDNNKNRAVKATLQNAQRHLKLALSRILRMNESSDIRNFVKKTNAYAILMTWHLLLALNHKKKTIDLSSINYKTAPKGLRHWIDLCWKDKLLSDDQQKFLDFADTARNLQRYRNYQNRNQLDEKAVKDLKAISHASISDDLVSKHLLFVEDEDWQLVRGSTVKTKGLGKLDRAVENALDRMNSAINLSKQIMKELA